MQAQVRAASKRFQLGQAVIVKQFALVYLVSNSSLVRVFGHLRRFLATFISISTTLVREEIFSGFFCNAILSIAAMALGVTVGLSAILLVLIGW
jgi:small basic protein